MIAQQGLNPMLGQGQMTPEQKAAWEQLMMLLGGLGKGPQVPLLSQAQPSAQAPILGGLNGR